MASNQFFIFAIVAILLPTVAMGTNYLVGDLSGWDVNVDYQEWAKDKVFRVGDRLVFMYFPSLHNVFMVDETAFNFCIAPPENRALTTGNDYVTLTTPGNKYYICGTPGHCAKFNQKLAITVVSENGEGVAPPPPPPSTANVAVKSGSQLVTVAMVAATMIIAF